MKLLQRSTPIKYSFIVFTFLFLIVSLLGISYFLNIVEDSKWSAVLSGLFAGFVVATFQALLSWVELKKLDEYDSLRIIKILPQRDSREYYGKFIATAKEKINLQGVTAQRLLEDFASEGDRSDYAKVLLAALGNGVVVRILTASHSELPVDEQAKAKQAEERMKELSARHPNFSYAYFDHPPAHVILTVDDESIIGPYFPGVKSRHSPAIHLKNTSEYVRRYLEYFDGEWAQWSEK
jgi:hypothetical protein